jgi:acyl-CoA synthetase (AMP-forming)/AMP-acid ligase II
VDEDLSSLRAVVAGCDGLPSGLLTAALERFDRPVSHLYGSADGFNCRGEYRVPGADCTLLDRPDPAVRAFEVRDEQGRPLPTGAAGELWARGPMSPLCDVGAPELDARGRDADGWVRTGDHGLVDDLGRLRLLPRARQPGRTGELSRTELARLAREILA